MLPASIEKSKETTKNTTEKEKEFELLIQKYDSTIQTLARATRDTIYHLNPTAVEVIWFKLRVAGYGVGIRRNSEHYHWIMPAKKHLTLGFNYGSELPDPTHLLVGTGKLLRHVKLTAISDLQNPALQTLMTIAKTYKMHFKPKT